MENKINTKNFLKNSRKGQVIMKTRGKNAKTLIENVHSCCSLVKMIMKKAAYTLSETTITLIIIGIIAGLTIPSVTNVYRKKQAEVGLLEAYTMLKNGLELSQIENGPYKKWPGMGGKGSLSKTDFNNKYILPYISPVVYTCNYYGNNGYKDRTKCFKDGMKSATGKTWGNGSCNACGFNALTAYKLKNGMSLSTKESGYNNLLFIVDINGPEKGRNMVGADIFMFSLKYGLQWGITSKDPYFPDFITGWAKVGYYIDRKDYIPTASELIDDCGPNPTRSTPQAEFGVIGDKCARRIELNGWKIPKDYPIKNF